MYRLVCFALARQYRIWSGKRASTYSARIIAHHTHHRCFRRGHHRRRRHRRPLSLSIARAWRIRSEQQCACCAPPTTTNSAKFVCAPLSLCVCACMPRTTNTVHATMCRVCVCVCVGLCASEHAHAPRAVAAATTLLTRSFTCREVQRPSFALTHLRRRERTEKLPSCGIGRRQRLEMGGRIVLARVH